MSCSCAILRIQRSLFSMFLLCEGGVEDCGFVLTGSIGNQLLALSTSLCPFVPPCCVHPVRTVARFYSKGSRTSAERFHEALLAKRQARIAKSWFFGWNYGPVILRDTAAR